MKHNNSQNDVKDKREELTREELLEELDRCYEMTSPSILHEQVFKQIKKFLAQKPKVSREDIRSILWEHFFGDGRRFLHILEDIQYQETMNQLVDEESEILSKKFAEKFKSKGIKVAD